MFLYPLTAKTYHDPTAIFQRMSPPNAVTPRRPYQFSIRPSSAVGSNHLPSIGATCQ